MDIRQAWLDYYQAKGFKIIPSSPLVHPAFPTSFNMSVGMVQLDYKIRLPKKIEPSEECLIQKCVRYFDINKVGDKGHLSFFEMAGAFEVVDFDYKKTITDTWCFLTEKLDIDPQELWITAFNKDKVVDKTIALPQEVKEFLPSLGAKSIVFGNQETNLWKQGGGVELTDNTRLCGPQVEFFYDQGEDKGCGKKECNPFCDCGRFLEICNILFIAYYIDYNQKQTLKKLINASTEVVIGIERTALAIENKSDIFETSYFAPLVKIISQNLTQDVKIIIDHLKSLTFILAEEKILPTKKDRGKIVRTLIRNLLTSCYVLKLDPQRYLPLLIDEVIRLYQKPYSEIKNAKNRVLEVVFNQEEEYQKTLTRGKNQIRRYLEKNNLKKIGPQEKEYFWKNFGVPEKLIEQLV